MSDLAPILFLDFDGTISSADVVDVLLERFARPAWKRLEDDWRAGKIGSRECLTGQVACIRTTPETLDAAVDAIALDRGLPQLLQTAANHGMPAYVVSDGFDYCIHRLLRALSLRGEAHLMPDVYASHLESTGGDRWRTAFRWFPEGCEHGCATCKPRAMAMLNADDRPMIFVGDGLSDRYAARVADVVFAKAALAGCCEREGIRYVPYGDLSGVAAEIERHMGSAGTWPLRARVEL